MEQDIHTLAGQANTVCENTGSETRYWIDDSNPDDVRFFICNSISTMDNIDEVSEREFRSRIDRVLLKQITDFRSKVYDMANSGKYGKYPLDLEEFNEAVEAGFNFDGSEWTAEDGTTISMNA